MHRKHETKRNEIKHAYLKTSLKTRPSCRTRASQWRLNSERNPPLESKRSPPRSKSGHPRTKVTRKPSKLELRITTERHAAEGHR